LRCCTSISGTSTSKLTLRALLLVDPLSLQLLDSVPTLLSVLNSQRLSGMSTRAVLPCAV
jgi:hypothetical protein